MECRYCHIQFDNEYIVGGAWCSHECQMNYILLINSSINLNFILKTTIKYASLPRTDYYYIGITTGQQKIINGIQLDQFQYKQQCNKRSNFVRVHLSKHLIKDIANIIIQYES